MKRDQSTLAAKRHPSEWSIDQESSKLSQLKEDLDDEAAFLNSKLEPELQMLEGRNSIDGAENAKATMIQKSLRDICFPRAVKDYAIEDSRSLFPVWGVHGVVSYSEKAEYPGDSVLISKRGDQMAIRYIRDFFKIPSCKSQDRSIVLQPLGGLSAEQLYFTLLRDHAEVLRRSSKKFSFENLPPQFDLPPSETWPRTGALLKGLRNRIALTKRKIELAENEANLRYWEWLQHEYGKNEGLQWTPSGRLPKGWILGSFGQYINFHNAPIGGMALKEEVKGGQFPVCSASGVTRWTHKPRLNGAGVIISRRGDFGQVTWVPLSHSFDKSALGIDSDLPREYIYLFLSNHEFLLQKSHFVIKQVSQKTYDRAPLLIPSSDALERFSAAVKPPFERIEALWREWRSDEARWEAWGQRFATGSFWIPELDELRERTRQKDLEFLHQARLQEERSRQIQKDQYLEQVGVELDFEYEEYYQKCFRTYPGVASAVKYLSGETFELETDKGRQDLLEMAQELGLNVMIGFKHL